MADPLRPLRQRARMPSVRRWALTACLLVIAAGICRAQTTYYVSPSGNNAWSGLAPTWDGVDGPKATVQAGVDATASGDTVIVAAGTYQGTVTIADTSITLTSTDPLDNSVVSATTLDGNNSGSTVVSLTCSQGQTNTSTVTGFTITSGYGKGVSVDGGSPTVSRNVITNCYGTSSAVDLLNGTPTFEHNSLSGCYGPLTAALNVSSCTGGAIRFNLVIDNSSYSGGTGGIHLLSSSIAVESNTLAGNSGTTSDGISSSNSSSVIRNNILWNASSSALELTVSGGTSPTVSYNCIQGGQTRVTGYTLGTTDISSDPLFADSANSDYHLKSEEGRWDASTQTWVTDTQTSPCIDAGDPASTYSGEPSPNGGCINMGCYGNGAEASKTPTSVSIVPSMTNVTVGEGGIAGLTVELSADPGANLVVSSAFLAGSDSDLSISLGSSLTFTPTDWDVGQTVQVSALEDADADDGIGTLQLSATGLTPVDVSVTEDDNDVTVTITGGTPAGTTAWSTGSVVGIEATPAAHYHFTEWTGDTANVADVFAAITTVTVNTDTALTADTAIDRHTVTAAADEHGTVTGGGIYDWNASIQLEALPDAGWEFIQWTGDVPAGSETDNPLSLTVTGDLFLTADIEEIGPEISVSPASLTVPEAATAQLSVCLTKAPAADVTVSAAIAAGGDADLSVQSGSSLTFTTTNWATTQPVTIAAAADDTDAADGTAGLELSGQDMDTVTVPLTEQDDDVTLTLAAGTGGTVAPSGVTACPVGTVVSITATPDANTTFTAWTGDTGTVADPNAAATTVTVNADISVTATFTAQSVTYYVDGTNGSDTYDGLAATRDGNSGPKATVQAGIDAASGGDVVIISAGTYYEQVTIADKSITLQSSDPTDSTVVSATTIDGMGSGNPALSLTAPTGTNTSTIDGLTFTAGSGKGIYSLDASPTITRCRVVDISSGPGNGAVELRNGAPVVEGCFIDNNRGWAIGGIHVNGSAGEIRNNLITDNCAGCDLGGGIVLVNATTVVENNTLYSNECQTADGIYISGGSPAIRNNIIWSYQWSNVAVYVASGTPTVAYNCIQNGQSAVSGITLDGTNTSTDPLFADATNGDFHLKSEYGRWDMSTQAWVTTDTQTSPCIDAGDPATAYTHETVPNGTCINVGRYGNTEEASRSQAANQPPVITEGETIGVTMDEDGAPTAFSLTLNATDPDPTDTLTWSLGTSAMNGTAGASGTGTSIAVSYSPDADWSGSDSFTVQVDDGNGNTDSITVNVTVQPRPDAPVIAGTPGAEVDEGEAYTFTPSVTDVDTGDTHVFSIANQPSWASFDTATGALTGTPGAADPGVYTDIVITVTDGDLLTDSLPAFSITVVGINDPPIVANPIADQGVAVNTAYSFTFAANAFTDPDVGDVLTFSATLADGSALPAWLSFVPATRTFSGTPGTTDAGMLEIRVTATDSAGATAVDEFLLAVVADPLADTDLDGLADAWETANFGDLTAGAGGDPDSDGAANWIEAGAGSDPNDGDSDDDLMPDGWEITYTLDPLNPADAAMDTDGDGMDNLTEYRMGRTPTIGIVAVPSEAVSLVVLTPQ